MYPQLARVLACTALLATASRVLAQFSAYHDADAATHQSKFNTLSAAGYRMRSLSIYGSPARYAAVWVKRTGPGWVAFHGATAAQYQTFFNTYAPQGFTPRILSATGSGASAVFAGVFEKDGASFWAKHNIDEATFKAECTKAQEQGYILAAATTYGTAAAPLYACSFKKNTAGIDWTYSLGDSVAEFQDIFDAFVSVGVRPDLVSVSDDQRYLAIWQDNKIGSWIARTGLTSAGYQSAFESYVPSGYWPMCVDGGGTGAATRFGALFVKDDAVDARLFTTTGVAVPALAGFDSYVKQLMQDNGVRGASLAVVKDCRLMLARGYTLAESGYPITQPTSLFRIASMSKPLTSIAMHRAFQNGNLTPGRTVTQVFGIAAPLDARLSQVTMSHLLTHLGGWDIGLLGFDPMFYDATIASSYALGLPISRQTIRSYMTFKKLQQHDPGTKSVYSNYGFMLAGLALEEVNPAWTFQNIVRRDVFQPLGVTRPRIGGSLLSQQAAGEVEYHPNTPGIRKSVMSTAQPIVPVQWGGWNQGNLDANGGWIMAPADYAKVLAAFDLGSQNPLINQTWTNHMFSSPLPATEPNLLRGWFSFNLKDASNVNRFSVQHNGGLPGTSTLGFRRNDGLAFVLFLNKDIAGGLHGSIHGVQLNALANAVPAAQWPNHDLFPSLGIPGFKKYTDGTLTTFGTGCAGKSGVLAHTAAGSADIGTTVGYQLANGPKSSVAVLYLGFSKTNWGPFVLPLALDAFGAPSCKLYTDPQLQIAMPTNAAGATLVNLPLPSNKALIGLQFFTQFVGVEPGFNKLGLTYSNGVQTKIGGWE